MKKMIHNLSKRTKSAIAACLAFVMIFGIITALSSVEAHAVTINASDLGFNSSNYYNAGSNTFKQGAQIRVINTSRSGKSKSDAIYTYASGSWMPVESTKYLVWDGNGNNTFHAVTPATDYAEYTSFTIPTNQSDISDEHFISYADWMTASYTGAKGDNDQINLNFEHRLAMVTIKINKWNSEFDDSNKTISDPKINSVAKMVNVTYGTGENSADVYSGDGTLTAITPKVGTDGETFTAIVAPLKYNEGDKFMTFKVGDEELSVYVPESLVTDGLEAGKHYTFNLTAGKERVTFEKVTVTDWSVTNINGGVAEECVPPTVEMSGKTAKITMPQYTLAGQVSEAMDDVVAKGATTIIVSGNVSQEYYDIIKSKRSGAMVYFKDLTDNNYISAAGNTYTCTVGSVSDEKYVLISNEKRSHSINTVNGGTYNDYASQLTAKDPGARAILESEAAWETYQSMVSYAFSLDTSSSFYVLLLGGSRRGFYKNGKMDTDIWAPAEHFTGPHNWFPVFDVQLS